MVSNCTLLWRAELDGGAAYTAAGLDASPLRLAGSLLSLPSVQISGDPGDGERAQKLGGWLNGTVSWGGAVSNGSWSGVPSSAPLLRWGGCSGCAAEQAAAAAGEPVHVARAMGEGAKAALQSSAAAALYNGTVDVAAGAAEWTLSFGARCEALGCVDCTDASPFDSIPASSCPGRHASNLHLQICIWARARRADPETAHAHASVSETGNDPTCRSARFFYAPKRRRQNKTPITENVTGKMPFSGWKQWTLA